MEYQAIDLATGAQVFHFGPLHGTNNIGEFLAIVHALALMEKQGINDKTIYSDSYNAILWVRNRKCKTKLERNEKNGTAVPNHRSCRTMASYTQRPYAHH